MDTYGVKDDRVRRRITRPSILRRLIVRIVWLGILLPLTIPGLALWAPVFATTTYYSNKMKRSGPMNMVYDEISHTKLIYGLLSGFLVYIAAVIVTFPISALTAVVVPLWMWMTLRWVEDLVSTFRALKSLWRMLRIPPLVLRGLQERRNDLHERVHEFARSLSLPDEPESFFTNSRDGPSSWRWGISAFESATDGEAEDPIDTAQKWLLSRADRSQKGRIRGNWDGITRSVFVRFALF